MGSRFIPVYPGRVTDFGSPMRNRDVDMITAGDNNFSASTLNVQDINFRTPKFPFLNTGTGDVFPGLWYGKDYTSGGDGVTAPAGGSVRPMALAYSFAAPGEEWLGVVAGSGLMVLDETVVTEPIALTEGASIFLDNNNGTPGYGRPELGLTGKQWFVGMLDSTVFDLNDRQIQITVHLEFQPTGGL